VLGVLFVRHRVANGYTNDHLRLLSIVASQIAAYLATSRLREQHEQIVRELRGLDLRKESLVLAERKGEPLPSA
jgi:GAF domain-containing protein